MLFVSMTTALLAACVISHRLDAAVLSATTEARRMVWGRLMTVVLHLQGSLLTFVSVGILERRVTGIILLMEQGILALGWRASFGRGEAWLPWKSMSR
jgi:hypothetical protein